jgi:hypothetical protein
MLSQAPKSEGYFDFAQYWLGGTLHSFSWLMLILRG